MRTFRAYLNRSVLSVVVFVATLSGALGQQLLDAEYFIDVDPGPGNGIPLTVNPGATASLDVSIPTGVLSPGLHIFSVRFKQEDGQWGITGSATFAVNMPVYPFSIQELSFPVVRGEYFWDEDPGPGNGQLILFPYGENIQSFFSINTGGLSLGSHLLCLRVMDLGYRWSMVNTYPVLVTEATGLSPIASFNLSPNPIELVPVLFNNTSLNIGPGSVYQWDMTADGLPNYTGFDAQHTFSSPGLYPVRLTVINEPSPLAQSANARFYFTNGSLADEGGWFEPLAPDGSPALSEGRQGDMLGAYSYGPDKFTTAGANAFVTALSLSYWFKGTSAEAGIRLFDTGGTQRLRSTNGTNHTVGANNVTANTPGLTNGQWNHVVVTWEPGATGGLKSYLNGVQVGSVNTSASPASFVIDSLVIGGIDGSTFASGSFDDILIFDYVLSPEDVQTLYIENYVSTYIEVVEVNMPSNQLTVDGALTFCSGTTTTLTAPPGTNFLWNTSETTQSIQVAQSGSWHCAYVDINGIPRLSNQVETQVYQSPVVDLTVYPASGPLQLGSAGISVTPGSGYLFQYAWSSGETGLVADSLSVGSYTVLVDDGVCQVVTPFDIVFDSASGPIVEAECFFDSPDPGPGNGMPFYVQSGGVSGAFSQLPLGALPVGTHIVSVRVKEDNGQWGITRSVPFSVNTPVENFEYFQAGPVVNAEYFFDDEDPGPGNGSGFSVGLPGETIAASHSFGLDGLSPGYHTVSVRTQNAAGHWGITRTLAFLIEPQLPPNLPDYHIPIVAAEYFFDNNDPGPGNATPIVLNPGTSISESEVLDINALGVGIHSVSVRTLDILGHWSTTRTNFFEIEELPCVTPEPGFSFGTVTAGVPALFTNTTTTAAAGVTYAWDVLADGSVESTTVNFSFTFENPGTYDLLLEVNNGDGCVSWVLQQVTVGPVLPAEILSDGPLTFCEYDTVNLSAPDGTGHIWNTGAFGQQINVASAGTYSCFYYDLNGNAAWTPSVQVTVLPAIQYSLAINSTTNGLANGSAGIFPGPGSGFVFSYQWSTGSTDPILSGVASGAYTVIVSDGVCLVTVEVFIPNELVTLDDEMIAGEYFWGADPGPGNGFGFVVQSENPSVNFIDLPTVGLLAGYHILSVRTRDAQNRWSITRTIPVYLTDPDAEPIQFTFDQLVSAEYFFDEEDPGPGNGIAIAVTNPGINPGFSADISLAGLVPGTHTVSVRMQDEFGRWGITRTSPIYVEPLIEPVDDTFWPIVAAEYFFGNNDPGPGNGTPLALAGGASISLPASVDVSGLSLGSHRISVRTKDLGGHWSITRSIVFDIIQPICPVPVVDFTVGGGNVGSPIPLINTSTNTLGGATYSWDIMANGFVEYTTENAVHTFTSPGTYYVSLTVDNGGQCVSTLVQEVQIGPDYSNLLNISGPPAFCEGGSVLLTAPGGSEFLWSTGATGQTLLVTESGLYQCFYTNPSGVQTSSNAVWITVWPIPVVNAVINDATNGQSNGSIGLLVSGGSSNLYTYLWNTGATSPIIVALPSGNYSAVVSDGQCLVNLNLNVNNLTVPVSQSIVMAEYFWDNSDPGPGNGFNLPIQEGLEVTGFANLPTAGLSVGYHLLSVRTRNSEGLWSITRTIPVQLFAPLTPEPSQLYDLVDAEYFFDNTDPGPGNATPLAVSNPGTSISEPYSLDCSTLEPGLHKVSVRVREETGKWSITRTGNFNLCFPPAPPTFLSTTNLLCAGTNLTMSVNNLGLNYIWTLPDGSTVTGAVLSVIGIQPAMTGWYSVVAEGEPGCYSTPITVFVTVETMPANPSLVLGPASVCVTNETAVFFINPIGNAVNYDWQFEINGNPQSFVILAGNNTNNIQVDLSGATASPVLVSVTAVNACGSATSSALVVNLTCGGCTDPLACNFNPAAEDDDGSCIADVTPPFFTYIPGNTTIECDQPIPFEMAAAADVCNDFSVTYADEINAGACPFQYTIVRTFTATDAAGNSSQINQIIGVIDSTAPVFVGDDTITIDQGEVGNIMISAFDNCGPVNITLTLDPQSGNPNYIYQYVATDNCGNLASFSQQVFVTGGISVFCESTLASCSNSTDGTAVVSVSGGVPPYDYQWSNGGLSATITDLLPGTYSVTVTDADGETTGCSVEVQSLADAVTGCMDPLACNYDPTANCPAFCDFITCAGCTDPAACEYDPAATLDNGSCTYPGCTDLSACNFDAAAGCDDGSCIPAPANLTITVLDQGIPVADMNVQLFFYTTGPALQSSISALTNGAGQATFSNLNPGNRICRAMPDYQNVAQQGFLPTYTNETFIWWAANLISIGCGDQLNDTIDIISFSSETGPGMVSGHVYFLTHSWGMMPDGEGQNLSTSFLAGDPIPGIPVIIMKDTLGSVPGSGFLPFQMEITNNEGTFDFSSLPLGNYRLHVDIPGLNHLIAPAGTDSTHFPVITMVSLIYEELNFYVDEEVGIYTINNDTTSVGEFGDRNHQLILYPNPFSHQMNLLTADAFGGRDYRWEVTDALGRKCNPQVIVRNRERLELNFEGMPRGVYFIRLWNGEMSYARKAVKH
jgi:PKD repeat protein